MLPWHVKPLFEWTSTPVASAVTSVLQHAPWQAEFEWAAFASNASCDDKCDALGDACAD